VSWALAATAGAFFLNKPCGKILSGGLEKIFIFA